MNTYPLPNLFIPGMQKAGTTALASFLSQHPDICLVEGKEAHIFDNPEFYKTKDKLTFAKENYQEKLRHYNGERYILDATPITILHPLFISSCAAICPNSKYIVMLRDPIERALSHYAMTRERGFEPFSPTKAFLLERSRMKGFYEQLPFSPFESKYRDQSYVIRGRYKKQLNYLQKQVSKSCIYIEQQKRLSTFHEDCMRDIFRFLELPYISIEKKEIFKSSETHRLPVFMRLFLRVLFKL